MEISGSRAEKRHNMNRLRRFRAFTIIEMVIVVVILSIVIGIAVPEIFSAIKESRAANCGSALRLIESAKDQWRREFPGAGDPTKDQLSRYFPGGVFPVDPWKVGFQNETSLNTVATHVYNNNPAHEPNGNSAPDNGYNDVFQMRR